jgi:PrtD family type I secretion system ABC transporter
MDERLQVRERPMKGKSPVRNSLWRETELDHTLGSCRFALGGLAVLSIAINLLMLATPLYTMQVYDRVLTSGHVETLIMLTGVALAALLLLGAIDALRTMLSVRISTWVAATLGPIYLAGGVRARIHGDMAGAQPLRDIAQVQSFITSQGLPAFLDMPWVPIFCLLIWFLHPALGALAVGSAFALVLLAVANDVLTRKATQAASIAQIGSNGFAEAIIRNAEVVRSMGMMGSLGQRWREQNDEALNALGQVGERSGILLGLIKFVRFAVQIGVLALGAWLVVKGGLTGGTMIAASILLGRALAPVEQGTGAWRAFRNAWFAYQRLQARARAVGPEPERIHLPRPEGMVSLVDVTLTIPGVREPVLRNISVSFKPGEAVAVIGPSASGKSSLCRLLVGIQSPSAGTVRIDGSDLQHWDRGQLGSHVGYLPQDVELFAGTVSENIARMEPSPDEDGVLAAAALSRAHVVVQQLSNGYETQIGEGGARLSGGQRQRLGLARAVYGDPVLVVLDEPNANLDQAGESALAAAVKDLKERGVALVIVGHRPSTLAEADKVLVLREGRIALFGPREEVLKAMQARSAEAARGREASLEEADEPEPAQPVLPADGPESGQRVLAAAEAVMH